MKEKCEGPVGRGREKSGDYGIGDAERRVCRKKKWEAFLRFSEDLGKTEPGTERNMKPMWRVRCNKMNRKY